MVLQSAWKHWNENNVAKDKFIKWIKMIGHNLEMSEIMSKVQLSWTDKLSLNQNLIDKLGV